MKRQQAPGQLEIVRSFLNTIDLERDVDTLGTVQGLAGWLANRLPETTPVAPSEPDRQAAVDLRSALRAVLAGAGAPDPTAVAALNRLLGRLPVWLRFTEELTPRLAAEHTGMAAALAKLVEIVAVATIDGTWSRLKMCPAEGCRWVFYDNARNRMGVWCQMTECGNRRKVRVHRSRSRGRPSG